MRRVLACALLITACSGGYGNAPFLARWEDKGFEHITLEGQPALVDHEHRIIYVESCDIAKRATENVASLGLIRASISQKLDPDPGQRAPLGAQSIAQPGELLLLAQVLLAGNQPLIS